MATVGSINLTIGIEGANARVRVRYNVYFDDFDRRSNLRYTEKCYIYGDDTGVGDSIFSGGDDSIPRGTITYRSISSNGNSSIARDYTKVFSRHELDEDGWPDGQDEIRAKVNLTPRTPVATRGRESNLVRSNF